MALFKAASSLSHSLWELNTIAIISYCYVNVLVSPLFVCSLPDCCPEATPINSNCINQFGASLVAALAKRYVFQLLFGSRRDAGRISHQQKHSSLHKLQNQRKSSKLSKNHMGTEGERTIKTAIILIKCWLYQKRHFPRNSNLTARKGHCAIHLHGKSREQHPPGVALDTHSLVDSDWDSIFPCFLRAVSFLFLSLFFSHKFSFSHVRTKILS